MTTSGHHLVMVRSRTEGLFGSSRHVGARKVMIAELKAKLSANLQRVQHGEEIIVMDRRRPVARIIPFREEKKKPKLVIHKATRPLSDIDKIPFVRPKADFDILEVLREVRKDRDLL